MKILEDGCLVAQFYMETEGDLVETAKETVRHETAGKWDRPGLPSELFQKSAGYILDYERLTADSGFVAFAYPLHNLDLVHSAFTGIWISMVTGMSAMPNLKKYRLLDFTLPDEAYDHFPGPRFGIEGTRKILRISDAEPIIGTIVKPTVGLTADEVAEICGEAAAAGIRFIKDDERMMNPAYCPLKERVTKVSRRLRQIFEVTGRTVIYAPHITTGTAKILDNARTAIEAGANALMFAFIVAGFESLRIVAESPDIHAPIYAHCCGKEHWSRADGQGIDQRVVAKLARMMGGDYFRIGALGGYFAKHEVGEAAVLKPALTEPMGRIRPAVPAVSGGLDPDNLPDNIRYFGTDALFLAGTGITKHPEGIRGGVEAMYDAATRTLDDAPSERKRHP
jgi:ribulose 1,5-bisphosphate carboxylase large subunit-like protein